MESTENIRQIKKDPDFKKWLWVCCGYKLDDIPEHRLYSAYMQYVNEQEQGEQ